jgi:hypothetical protein
LGTLGRRAALEFGARLDCANAGRQVAARSYDQWHMGFFASTVASTDLDGGVIVDSVASER